MMMAVVQVLKMSSRWNWVQNEWSFWWSSKIARIGGRSVDVSDDPNKLLATS